MNISSDEYDLLTELAEQYDYPDLDPTKHVTAGMLADRLGISRRTAYERLERQRKEGKLKMEKVVKANSRISNGYYKTDN